MKTIVDVFKRFMALVNCDWKFGKFSGKIENLEKITENFSGKSKKTIFYFYQISIHFITNSQIN